MFFEGPEKKVEVVVSPAVPSLRSLGEAYWHGIVERAQAKILSKMSNDECDAYLLSESSLFVLDRRIVMITCGRTTLVDAVQELLKRVPASEVELLVYERKNQLFPEYQTTNFFQDAQRLRELLPGRAYRLGDEDDHHIYLYQFDRGYQPCREDSTLEILMHGIHESAREVYCGGRKEDIGFIRRHSGMHEILPGFRIDDYLFQPAGYSLNAIKGREYYTIHVTPEPVGSYVSFETNHAFHGDMGETVERVLEIFRPKSADIVFFQPAGGLQPVQCRYRLKRSYHRELSSGLKVQFSHFFEPQERSEPACELEIP